MPSEKDIMEALQRVMDPELHRSIVELNMVRDLKIEDSAVSFTLALTVPTCPMRNQMADNARSILMGMPGVEKVDLQFGAMTDEERRALMGGQQGLPKLNQFNKIDHVVAVMSGKGGVGKSSVTALLAAALARRGYKVGVLDADITGPSIPKLFGLPSGGLRGSEAGMLPASTKTGIKVVSINLLLKEADTPVIWRGPMIAGAIQQFYNDALWGKLDYLLVDLPPGTSDAALTVVQSLPLSGVVMVTTPQDLATLVVRKAVHMVQQLNIPVLGIVENMSYFECPDNGKRYELFGPSHAGEVAAATGAPVAARMPVNPAVATLSDAGKVEEVDAPEMEALAERIGQALRKS